MSEERIIGSSKDVTTTRVGTITCNPTSNPVKELNDTLKENFRVINTALLSELEQSRKTIKTLELLSKTQMDREHIKSNTITKLQETNEHLADNLATVVGEKESLEQELNACKVELTDTRLYLGDVQHLLKRTQTDRDRYSEMYSEMCNRYRAGKESITRHFTLNIFLTVTIIAMVIAANIR